MSPELGECIARDSRLLKQLGWKAFVKRKRPRSDIASLENVDHPARDLLKFYKNRGAPVKFKTPPWGRPRVLRALKRGPHQSCREHVDFLHEEFADMVAKGQWVVLPAADVLDLPGLRVSPSGVVPQVGRRPRTIVDYSFSDVNEETLPLAAMEAMQFGHALDRLLREILLADPRHGPVHMMKVDLSDGFYRICLNINDIPKLGIVFPSKVPGEQLIAFPLVLPMGWKNSPPIFSSFTETSADLANARCLSTRDPEPHPLDDAAHAVQCPLQASRDSEMTPTTTVGAAGDGVPKPHRRLPQKSSQVNSQGCSESDFKPTTATGAAGRAPRVPAQKPSTAEQQPVDCSVSDLQPTTATGAAGRVQRVPAHKPSTAEQHSSSSHNPKCHPSVPAPTDRDPSIPSQPRPLSYVDIFVDDFLGLCTL